MPLGFAKQYTDWTKLKFGSCLFSSKLLRIFPFLHSLKRFHSLQLEWGRSLCPDNRRSLYHLINYTKLPGNNWSSIQMSAAISTGSQPIGFITDNCTLICAKWQYMVSVINCDRGWALQQGHWPNVGDAGPTLRQRWAGIPCSLDSHKDGTGRKLGIINC